MKRIFLEVMVLLAILSASAAVSATDVRPTGNPIELTLRTNYGNTARVSAAYYIQNALRPLGIKVNVEIIPYGSFVGDLFHDQVGKPYDLAIIGFSGGGPFQDFMWKLHSTRTSFGQTMYQLDDPQWQSNMISDMGITTAEVDQLLESIDYELDPQIRVQKTLDFNELYMTKLLYDYPLFSPYSVGSMWKGIENPKGDVFNPREGLTNAAKLGFSWGDATPARREGSSTSLNLATSPASKPGNFDKYQSFDVSTTKQSQFLYDSLLMFDETFTPHPGVAYQWFSEDVTYDSDNDPATPDVLVEQGKHTFIINPDYQFGATTNINGNSVPAQSVDANDVALTLDLLMESQRRGASIDGLGRYLPITNYEVTTTVSTNDTISIYLDKGQIDDYAILGSIVPLPEHLLGSLTTQEGVPFSLGDGTNYNPQQSLEWKHWASESGNTYAGPMTLDHYDYNNGWTFTARSDYPFPNEWDTMNFYDANSASFDNLYKALNTDGWTVGAATSLRTFAPHLGVSDAAYYYAYNDNGNMEKPSSQSITDVVYKVFPDLDSQLPAFESGALDWIDSGSMGRETINSHKASSNFDVYSYISQSPRGPTLLVFNLLNEHLQKSDVRRAIGLAINNEELANNPYTNLVPHHATIWRTYPIYNDEFGLFYDLQAARGLMTAAGYTIPNGMNTAVEPVLHEMVVKPDQQYIQRNQYEVVDYGRSPDPEVPSIVSATSIWLLAVVLIISIVLYYKRTKLQL